MKLKLVSRFILPVLLVALASCVAVEAPAPENGAGALFVTLKSGETSDFSTEQGDGFEDLHLWAFSCNGAGEVLDDEPAAYAYANFLDGEGFVSSFGSVGMVLELDVPLGGEASGAASGTASGVSSGSGGPYYLLVAVANTAHFGYLYLGGETSDAVYEDVLFDEYTTYSTLAAAKFDGYSGYEGGFAMDGLIWETIEDEADGEPYCVPASGCGLVDVSAGFSVELEITRAVGKVSLYMAKASEDVQLVVDEVLIVSSYAPYEGAVLEGTLVSTEIYSDWFEAFLVNSTDISSEGGDVVVDGSEGDSSEGGDVVVDGSEGGDVVVDGAEGDSGDLSGEENFVPCGTFVPVAVGPLCLDDESGDSYTFYSPSALEGSDGHFYEYIGARFLFENSAGWSDITTFEAAQFLLSPLDEDSGCTGYFLAVTYRYTTSQEISLTDEYGYPLPAGDFTEDSYTADQLAQIQTLTKYIPLPAIARGHHQRVKVILETE